MAMCTRVCSPSEPPYAMRYPPGTRTTQGDSTPNSSVSPTRPGSTATPTCSHFEPTALTASMIRTVVPSWPEYHMRSVPSRSSRTQGLLARALSGSPGDPGEKTSPSCVHSTIGPLACLRGDHGLPDSVRWAGRSVEERRRHVAVPTVDRDLHGDLSSGGAGWPLRRHVISRTNETRQSRFV